MAQRCASGNKKCNMPQHLCRRNDIKFINLFALAHDSWKIYY